MMWDKKKAMQTLIGRRKPSGEKLMEPTEMQHEVVKHEDGEIDGRHLAAQEALGAIHSKSPEDFMNALMNFIDLHDHHKSKPVPHEE